MAKTKLNGEEKKPHPRAFLPGNPGGPGRPPKHPELAGLNPLTRSDWTLKFTRFFNMTKRELEDFIKNDDKEKIADIIIAGIVLKTIKDGDDKKLDFMLDRTVGKVKDIVQLEVPKPYIIRRRDGSVEELGTTKTQTRDMTLAAASDRGLLPERGYHDE